MTDFDFGDIDSPQIITPDTYLDTSPTVAPPPTGKKYRVIISSEANKPSIRYLAINGVSRYVQVDVEVELEEEFVRMLSEGTRPMPRETRVDGIGSIESINVRAHQFQVLGPA